jgi:beta-lactam-binding protein with PASTA domain
MGFIKFLFSKTFLKNIFAAILVSIALVIALFYWLNYYTNHQEYIQVPDLSKLSVDIVEQKLEDMNLRYKIMDFTAYNPEYPPFSVVEQNPQAGQSVKENRKIYLTINPKDYAKIAIPKNAVGYTQRQVKPTLISLGFKIGETTEKPHMAKNEVLELLHDGKEIKPGDSLKKTSVIDLVVGDGSLNYGETAPDEGDNNE